MKIVSWNCHYEYGKFKGLTLEKYEKIKEFKPNILLIQECTKKEFDQVKMEWKYKNWYCDDLFEDSVIGVAIFSNEFEIEFSDLFNRNFRYVIPYVAKNDNFEIYIFSVWIKPYEKDYLKGIEKHLYASKEYYKDMLDKKAMFIGDFNIYAKEDNERLQILEDKFKPMINCTQDTSFRNTVTYYDSQYGYGIDDFCFVSESLYAYRKEIKIETHDQKSWNGSDHCPIMVEFCF